MLRLLAPFVFGLLWAGPGLAAVVSAGPDKTALVIYETENTDMAEHENPGYAPTLRHYGIAFIAETRTVELPAGAVNVEFRGVMSTIVPQTAEISGLPTNAAEHNFDYNLLSPGSLLAKSVGQTVRLVRTDPSTGKASEEAAIVRSAPNGTMFEINGKLEALHCSGLPEKVIFEKIPDGLRDTPTLSMRAMIAQAGRYTISLNYIATGMFWWASYNARINPDGQSLDLSGWITLSNFSDTGYRKIPVELVAGRILTTGADQSVFRNTLPAVDACWGTNVDWASAANRFTALYKRLHGIGIPQQGLYSSSPVTAVSQQEMKLDSQELGDLKLYRLPEATGVASHQTKQVQFLARHGVSFERIYSYSVSADTAAAADQPATSMLRLHNTEAAGLGMPLPSGTVSVFEQSADGSPVLVGQHEAPDTPSGLPLEIETGHAIDVRVKQRETDVQSVGRDKSKLARATYEIMVENDKSIPIRFELSSSVLDGVQLVAEDQPHSIGPKGMIWSFAIAAGERETMHFTIDRPES